VTLQGSDPQSYAFTPVFNIFSSTAVETNEELMDFSVKCGYFTAERTGTGYVRKVRRFEGQKQLLG